MPYHDDEERGDQWSPEGGAQAVPAGGPPQAPPPAPLEAVRAPSHRRRLRSRRPRQRQTARQVGGSIGDKAVLAAALGFGGYMVYYLYKSSEGGYGGSDDGGSSNSSPNGGGSNGGTEATGRAVVPMSHREPENLAAEAADDAKERWDNMSAAPEMVSRLLDEDVLEIKIVTSFDLEPRNFILVTGTGGPHIEVDVGAEEVEVWWGSDHSTRRINNPNGLMEAIDARLEETWRSIAG